MSRSINKRINDLTFLNKDLEGELRRIKKISMELHVEKTGIIKGNEFIEESKNKIDMSFKRELSLKEIEKIHLENDKITQSNYLIMNAILLSNNINYETFCSYLKINQTTYKDDYSLYFSLLKYFMKLTTIYDLEDLFSIHTICKGISNQYETSDSSQFNNFLKKKLFFEGNSELENHLDIIYELKEVSF